MKKTSHELPGFVAVFYSQYVGTVKKNETIVFFSDFLYTRLNRSYYRSGYFGLFYR